MNKTIFSKKLYITKQKIKYIINSIHSRNKEKEEYDIKEIPEIIKNLKDATKNKNETNILIDNEKIDDKKLYLKTKEYDKRYSEFLKIPPGFLHINKIIFLNNNIYTLLFDKTRYYQYTQYKLNKTIFLYSYNLETKKDSISSIYMDDIASSLDFKFFKIQFFLHKDNIYLYIEKKLYLLNVLNNTLTLYMDLSDYVAGGTPTTSLPRDPFLISYNQEIHFLGAKNPSSSNVMNYHYKIDDNKNITFVEQLPFNIAAFYQSQAVLVKDDKIFVPLTYKLNANYTDWIRNKNYFYGYEDNSWQVMMEEISNYTSSTIKLAAAYPYQDDVLLFYCNSSDNTQITVKSLYYDENYRKYSNIKMKSENSVPLPRFPTSNQFSPIYCFTMNNKLYLNSSYIVDTKDNYDYTNANLKKPYERILGYNEEYNLWEGNKYKIEKRE